MSVQTQARSAPQYEGSPLPTYTKAPITANTILYPGSLIQMIASTGKCLPALAGQVGPMLGVSDDTYDNSTANTTGFPPASVASKIKTGVFPFANSSGGDAIALGNVGQPCFAVDDHTVALTDGGGTRPFAGIIWDFDATVPGCSGYPVWVLVGPFVTPGISQGGAAPVVGSIVSLQIALTSLVVGGATPVLAITPGFAGKILGFQYVGTVAPTGTGATIALQAEVTPNGGSNTPCTGGAATLTLATATVGCDIISTPVTAGGEFGPADSIGINSAAGTVFTAGSGSLLISLVAA